MERMKVASEDAYNYLMEKNPHSWARCFFKVGVDCEAVENGLCESSNSNIRGVRKKHIIGMLEEIRRKVMIRNESLRKEAATWKDALCPNIRKKLELNKRIQRYYLVNFISINSIILLLVCINLVCQLVLQEMVCLVKWD